ncbi:MAG: hypothetical protein KI791_03385 [Cyclobacteriaceae bacterium]|nr:hypothetical protein [Cyclobacteriaceae bacterium SS2]
MKGGVLLIGSLLWEDETNSLNKEQGKLREKWRENLEISNKIYTKVPIRYGRKSTSKRCTYTMLFSNSVEQLGTAVIIPFINETETFNDIKNQALSLSYAEGISNKRYPDRLIASWGAVGITFNKSKDEEYVELKKKWHDEFDHFDNVNYKIGTESPSISKKGELNFNLDLPEMLDYVFATPVIPNISMYPTSDKIVSAILESKPKYDTYVKQNFINGIRVHDDEKIIERIG